VADEGFIGLPPGFVPSAPDHTSGTVKRERPERTRSGSDDIVFFPAAPGVPVQPAPAAAEEPAEDDATRVAARHAAPAWRLVVPGYGPVPVEGTLFLGRNPVATAGHPDARVLAIADEAKSLSKTHAMLELDGDLLWVHDLDSTNGVWVVPVDGEAVEVVPGHRAPVPAGGDLELGDLVIQVEHG